MEISLNNIWKRYNAGWVIRDLSLEIYPGEKVGVTGPNGSGKSTLLQLISGVLSVSRGSIIYTQEEQAIDRDDIFRYCAIAAAYSELDEELTIRELFGHYKRFKPVRTSDEKAFLSQSGFQNMGDRPVGQFSSGMKQRLLLSLALNYDVPLCLLDEPGSFLDADRKAWLEERMGLLSPNQTVVIASNDPSDLDLCTRVIELV